MNKRRLSIDEIREIVIPVACAYGVERVALFGSYARGDAKLSSDVDLHVDKGSIKGLFRLAGFQRELEEGLSLHVDVLTTGSLGPIFLDRIKREEIVLYEK
jgi:predicted nucleotidyltransferase